MITAKNDNYKFSKSSTSFTVEENNLIVPDGSLVISGYDVSGQVLFNGEPTVGVTFVLFANDEVNDNNNNNDYLHSYSKFIYLLIFFFKLIEKSKNQNRRLFEIGTCQFQK